MNNIIREDKRRKLDRPITGIIQDDRIWEQWYKKDVFNQKFPKMSQKDYLFKCIKDDPSRIMINNRGKSKFSVSKFCNYVEKFEKSFAALSLNKGDIVCTLALSSPEMYAIKYSATSLGLITCNLNVLDAGTKDDNQNRLYSRIREIQPKIIFTMDILEDKVYTILNSKEFDNIIKISLPLDYSLPSSDIEKHLLNLKAISNKLHKKNIKNQMSLNQFLKKGNSIEHVDEYYSEGQPCNISFTSGTTNTNKAVLLSHDANNALAFQQLIGKIGFVKGEKQLCLIPPFLAFWDADVVHAVLSLGGENIIELSLDDEKIKEYFKKYVVNVGIWTQYSWNALLDLDESNLNKISENLIHAIIGGERCEINAAETFYQKTKVMPICGYGATEVNTTFSVCHPNCNKLGTAGIPLPFNNVKIVDDSMKDLTYNKPGRLLVTGPCLMNGYYNRPDLTDESIYVDDKGVRWYNTGDYATVDDDGCLTVLDRYSSPVIINRGDVEESVNLVDIAETIKENRNIKICKITYYDNKLMFHIEIDKSICQSDEVAKNSILETIKCKLPEKYWPNIISFAKLPRTQVGKVDYKELSVISEEELSNITNDDKLLIE